MFHKPTLQIPKIPKIPEDLKYNSQLVYGFESFRFFTVLEEKRREEKREWGGGK